MPYYLLIEAFLGNTHSFYFYLGHLGGDGNMGTKSAQYQTRHDEINDII